MSKVFQVQSLYSFKTEGGGMARQGNKFPSITLPGLEKISHFNRRHYVQRLRLPAEKICTVVFLGLPTAEFLRLRSGQLLINLYINPKLIFMTLSPSIPLLFWYVSNLCPIAKGAVVQSKYSSVLFLFLIIIVNAGFSQSVAISKVQNSHQNTFL